ncbi:MAG TPA: PDZ domain-containing protein [Pyrinomonadaceae bacterium]|nr:PDZ domain-containing protein [Pyrinomonadaceae bacterium]
MHSGCYPVLKLTIALIVCSLTVAAQQATSRGVAPEIAFNVSMSKPHTHMLEVEVRVKRPAGMQVPAEDFLVMPVWTPGSYLVREFARHVQDFSAADSSGRALQWEKTNKNTWRIVTAGAREWHASYRVYANELSVRTNQLNSDHAFWNNAALLMYLDGFLTAPSTLHILAPQPWKVATGLPAAGKNTFRAENFDVLYDSPVEVSNFKTISFTVKNVPHRIVIDGEGNYDSERLKRDVQKIVEASVELMGGEIPYRDYTFITHLRANTGGGLEHLNSTALGFSRFSFQPESSYRGVLGTIAHEFFHLWNVKRIRPDALGPFDYTKENYTKLLWVAEGVTSYYQDVIMRRAGLITDKEFLETIAKAFQSYQRVPGRRVMNAEEASFDTWIKYYRQDENSVNSQIDYYDKGAILGLLLDLEIRKLSHNAKSLDDVMRALYTEFFKQGRNYTPADFQRLCEQMAGASLDDFFARYVRGREEHDYNRALAAAGLRLNTSEASGGAKATEKAYLGADLRQEGDRLMVSRVLEGSPAYEQGLNTGDQIVAFDNMRVNRDFFDTRLAEKHPGQLVSLTIFRFDDLSALPIKLGSVSDAVYRIVPAEKPTEEQRRIYGSWIGMN